ncbi:MAG: AMMECR1 domain-containing protein, partial [Planctomycetaceae bacterium]|nr:AMMECR1 domain-containing protein [Planctomycetaceae bacterium]
EEVDELELHISVLSDSQPIPMVTEADLLGQLRPGIDGVILIESDLRQQGLFLPSVWEQIPEPRAFVRRLKRKAGLPENYWSPWMQAKRFTVEAFGDEASVATPECGSPSS